MNSGTPELLKAVRHGDACVVSIGGSTVDGLASNDFSNRLMALLHETKVRRFILDFSEVNYMESACLGQLVSFARLLTRCDGKMALVNVRPNVRGVFEVTRLDRFFRIYVDVAGAMAGM